MGMIAQVRWYWSGIASELCAGLMKSRDSRLVYIQSWERKLVDMELGRDCCFNTEL